MRSLIEEDVSEEHRPWVIDCTPCSFLNLSPSRSLLQYRDYFSNSHLISTTFRFLSLQQVGHLQKDKVKYYSFISREIC